MRLLQEMDEGRFRNWETIRAHGLTRWMRVVGLVMGLIGLLLGAGLFLMLYWEAKNMGLMQALARMGWIVVAFPAFLVACAIGGWFSREWLYRKTKALPSSVRGFDIEARPMNQSYREALENENRINVAWGEKQQRDWESTRAHGATRFVILWSLGFLALGAFFFLLFWLIPPGGGSIRLEDAWEAFGWESASFAVIGVAFGISFWFFCEWRYRKKKVGTVVGP